MSSENVCPFCWVAQNENRVAARVAVTARFPPLSTLATCPEHTLLSSRNLALLLFGQSRLTCKLLLAPPAPCLPFITLACVERVENDYKHRRFLI